MRKVIGVGETILDIIFKDNQPKAAMPGGSVFNACVSLGRLNIPLCFIGEVGNDRVGDIITGFMECNGLRTEHISRTPDSQTPLAIAFLNQNNEADYMFYKDTAKQRLETMMPQICEDDVFIFGSYYALNPALRERITELLELARSRNAIIYYDPNFRNAHAHEIVKLRPAILENFEYADIIRGSRDDFFNILNEQNMDRIYDEHIKFYCPRLIVTGGGEHDVILYDRKRRQDYPTRPANIISTIGAGDNFNAGIIYGLLKHDIRRRDLSNLSDHQWTMLMQGALDLATEACMSSENYISTQFANDYIKQIL